MNVELFRSTISQETKRAFKSACEQYEVSMTEIIDTLIIFFIENPELIMKFWENGPSKE